MRNETQLHNPIRGLHLTFSFAALVLFSHPLPAAENLAPRAAVSANSQYNHRYAPKWAVDGVIPEEASQSRDLDHAWCVRKEKSGDQGWFRLEWKEPVTVAEVVYFGRTSWFMNECWKEYALFVDDGAKPVVEGTFEMRHGPQKITLPEPRRVRSLKLVFKNSYGGFNPGAAEIAVFDAPPSTDELVRRFGRCCAAGEAHLPPYLRGLGIDRPDPEKLGALIGRLTELHGAEYADADEHAAAFAKIGGDDVEALAELQREVLLHDVDKLIAVKRYEITASHVYTYHYEGQRNGGGIYLIDPHHPGAKPVELVASPDGQILDCDLSYDAKRVLFSMRRGSAPGYHIYVVNTDGTGLAQLTDGPWHDYNACWLPDGGIAFLSSREPQFAYCWHAPVGILHRMEADGSGVQKLSANYLNDFTPYVLEDGRIIYSRWEYVDRPAIPIQSLWTVAPDGTGLSGYFGNRVLSPGTFMDARSVPGTLSILCTMTGHNGPTRGAIGLITRAEGVNDQDAIVNLTPDTPLPNVDQGNGNTAGTKPYSCPVPLDSERFLVSARGPVLVRTIDGACQSVALPAPKDGMQYFFTQPVRPRTRPPVVSGLHRHEEPAKDAVVFVQDVYNGLEPTVRRGEVTHLRVVQEMSKPLRIDPSLRAFGFQFPVISCGATYAAKNVLGEVPVDAEGSACFTVPAGRPVYFMALDADGRAVQRMRSFTHFMPGETQGCVGCHEHRTSVAKAPSHIPSSLEPLPLAPPEWGRGGFSYTRVVQPIWDKHCVECHNPIDTVSGLDLTGDKTDFFSVSYDMLARENQGREGSPYVNWIPTYNGQEWNILEVMPKRWGSHRSRLAEVIATNHACTEEHKQKFTLTPEERRRVYAWIDLNVPYYGTSETANPGRIGCRHLYPAGLDGLLADVGRRRCAACHQPTKSGRHGPEQQQAAVGGILPAAVPRHVWTRITRPELNAFLLAPLAKSAGGTQKCGKPVFANKNDADYRKILEAFAEVTAKLEQTPRVDMEGGKACETVDRCCE